MIDVAVDSERHSVLKIRDLFLEAGYGISQRPGRVVLTAVGTILGIGSLVAILGLTMTIQAQISDRFTASVATEITVEDLGGDSPELSPMAFTADADLRAKRIDGVLGAGFWWKVKSDAPIAVAARKLPGQGYSNDIPIIAASAGVFDAVHAVMRAGRTFDIGHENRADRVAVLGSGLASTLGISSLVQHPAIFLNDLPFAVVGIVSDMDRSPELLSTVMIPDRTAEKLWPSPTGADQAKMLVVTRLGAAQVVSRQLALALRPDAVDRLKVVPPPDPKTLKGQVTSDLGSLFLVLAVICLVVGAVGIANTTMVAVLERIPEIGLRRSLGARRIHVAAQFLLESGMTGAFGGLIGTSLGTIVVVAVAVSRIWTPVLPLWVVLCSPLLGATVGLMAGLYPAVRAALVEPIAALQR